MTDEDNDMIEQKTELDMLKERANLMGISFRANIGVEKLRAKISAKLNGEIVPDDEDEDTDQVDQTQVQAPEVARTETAAEARIRLRTEQRLEKMKLIRCRIYNLDPSKKDLEGEIFTVSNNVLGAVKKFVPYGDKSENGYHIPQIMLDALRNRKFQQVSTRKVNGQLQVRKRQVPEFNIEILPPLTEDEIHDLAQRQTAVAGLSGSED